jgi:hypothetical protein
MNTKKNIFFTKIIEKINNFQISKLMIILLSYFKFFYFLLYFKFIFCFYLENRDNFDIF